jgi:hypothetical protein
MSIQDVIFLTLVCLGYGAFMVVLASAAWYCRESAIAQKPAPAAYKARRGRNLY